MSDMLRPEKDGNFTMTEFRHHNAIAGIFFNALCNLNKFVAYEQRDPFQFKGEMNEYPGWSDWDKFAKQEYHRLAVEDDTAEDSDMLEGTDAWDSDTDVKDNLV